MYGLTREELDAFAVDSHKKAVAAYEKGVYKDEIIALDPNLPELAGLTAEFDELRKAVSTRHRGPWLLAAAVFVVVVLGASYLQEATSLPSYPVNAEVSLITPPRPSLLMAGPLMALSGLLFAAFPVETSTPGRLTAYVPFGIGQALGRAGGGLLARRGRARDGAAAPQAP